MSRSATRQRRTARLEQRMAPSEKELIEHAAALQGMNASEFVLVHSVSAARETINRLETTRLAPEDRDAFVRAFQDEAVNSALVDLFDLHRRATAPEAARADGR
jgi:uncharacterized protein (DUF1778 family)